MMEVMFFMLFMFFMLSSSFYQFLKLLNQNLSFVLSFFMLVYGQVDYYWCSSSQVFFCGFDQYNYILLVFLFWLVGLSFLGLVNSSKLNLFLLYILMVLIFLAFSSMNFMVFYFFFEASLLPIFFLILSLGTNYKRLVAGVYMLLYTLVFSLPLFLVMSYCYYNFNSLMMIYLFYDNLEVDFVLFVLFIMAFLVKMPMYSLHIWLPKAHVEAPCSGSMILAGILLKLGSYGLLRSMLMMLGSSVKFNVVFISYGLIGSLISSVVCLRQSDLKMLIAYSSVVHMGMMMSGMMTMGLLGYLGSLYMMIGHGLCSSGLFFAVGINYERLGSRMVYVNKGLINIVPSMTLWWFLFSSSNMAAPISLNLLSEGFLIMSLVLFDNLMIFLLVFISFFSACYSIYMFSVSQHGGVNDLLIKMSPVSAMEYLCLILHWFPLNILIMNVGVFN